jgi:hypothetical protein
MFLMIRQWKWANYVVLSSSKIDPNEQLIFPVSQSYEAESGKVQGRILVAYSSGLVLGSATSQLCDLRQVT